MLLSCASHGLYDIADALANDVLVSDLSCLDIENSIDPDSVAFLARHHPQRLNSAAAAGFLMGIDRRKCLVDLDPGEAFCRDCLGKLASRDNGR